MQNKVAEVIAEIRLLVGYLGEKAQHNWWGSNFLGASSGAFLQHTFPRTTLLSQYHGVAEAALLVHDEYVGVGHNYHLYRLPVSIERDVANAVQQMTAEHQAIANLKSIEDAQQRLSELAIEAIAQDGPTNIGLFEDKNLEHLLLTSAGLYLSAFKQGIKCLPFMRGQNAEA
ncbi:BrxE family protein [Alteromonas sp. CYL-A6]|uniref:BrxE family protein n=1 Tax=Alteromonas nitratireducens TaxID=3390813 RepID=UPI0034AD7223